MWVCSWKVNILPLCVQKIMFMSLQNWGTGWFVVNPSNEIASLNPHEGLMRAKWLILTGNNPTLQFSLCIYKVFVISESRCHKAKSQTPRACYLLTLMIVYKLISLRLSFLMDRRRLIIIPVTPHRWWGWHGWAEAGGQPLLLCVLSSMLSNFPHPPFSPHGNPHFQALVP